MFAYESIITTTCFLSLCCLFVSPYVRLFLGVEDTIKGYPSAPLMILIEVFHPDDQTFTNIGGAIGYHANLFIKKKRVRSCRVLTPQLPCSQDIHGFIFPYQNS